MNSYVLLARNIQYYVTTKVTENLCTHAVGTEKHNPLPSLMAGSLRYSMFDSVDPHVGPSMDHKILLHAGRHLVSATGLIDRDHHHC